MKTASLSDLSLAGTSGADPDGKRQRAALRQGRAEMRSLRMDGGVAKRLFQSEGGGGASSKKFSPGQTTETTGRNANASSKEGGRRAVPTPDLPSTDRAVRTASPRAQAGERRSASSKAPAGRGGQQGKQGQQDGSGGKQQQNGQSQSQKSASSSKQGQSQTQANGRKNGGRKNGAGAKAATRTLNAASRRGQGPNASGGTSLNDLFPGKGTGAEARGKNWTSALSDLGKAAPSGKSGQAGGGSGSPRTLPTAWLKTATNGPLRTTELASGWKSMELSLGKDNGTVTVQTQSDQDGMSVSVRFSDAQLRSRVAANARQLQNAMQGQYGSDVNLSFTGGDAGTSGQQTPDGSASQDRSRSSASGDAISDEGASDSSPRRSAHGGREWIG